MASLVSNRALIEKYQTEKVIVVDSKNELHPKNLNKEEILIDTGGALP